MKVCIYRICMYIGMKVSMLACIHRRHSSTHTQIEKRLPHNPSRSVSQSSASGVSVPESSAVKLYQIPFTNIQGRHH